MSAVSVSESGVRPILADAVDLARRALLELEPTGVGAHLGVVSEDESAATHRFEATLPGYRGWQWAVVVAAPPEAEYATVSESALLPGPDALVAPDFVPWEQRIRPGDLAPGDLLAPPPDDPRLVPGYVANGDEAVDEVALEIGLGRTQVMSLEGREEAAERWYNEYGPDAEMAKAAPSTCGLCGFYLPLAGSLRAAFGVCGNAMGADGHVVHTAYGCGAHSDTVAPTGGGSPLYEAFDDAAVELIPTEALLAPAQGTGAARSDSADVDAAATGETAAADGETSKTTAADAQVPEAESATVVSEGESAEAAGVASADAAPTTDAVGSDTVPSANVAGVDDASSADVAGVDDASSADVADSDAVAPKAAIAGADVAPSVEVAAGDVVHSPNVAGGEAGPKGDVADSDAASSAAVVGDVAPTADAAGTDVAPSAGAAGSGVGSDADVTGDVAPRGTVAGSDAAPGGDAAVGAGESVDSDGAGSAPTVEVAVEPSVEEIVLAESGDSVVEADSGAVGGDESGSAPAGPESGVASDAQAGDDSGAADAGAVNRGDDVVADAAQAAVRDEDGDGRAVESSPQS
ncbi:hypothetical protein DFR70_103530 [Nocardia tenerifensis]|uniref:DUF3027 family protein n=1 Tax=Nocardia tenerifensis TaxID=228006 RepID=A0A318K5P7_9NOCA|nr:hypothetical protein DFR70_103530 [Nocardia tenerifensis]